MDNSRPNWITRAQKAIGASFIRMMRSEKGQVTIPFIDSVDEGLKPAVTNFITNSGATSEEIAGFNSFDEFLSGYKSKAPVVTDWREGLDVAIKEHPSLKTFKTSGDLAKSWVEAQKLIGRDKIPVPGENATKEDWDMVFDRLGRPKTAEEYKLPEVKLPDGFPMPKDEFFKELRSKAHELGVLPAQLNGLYEWFMANEANQFNQFNTEREAAQTQAETALRKAWGKAFEQNYAIAEQAVNKYGTEKFIEKLKLTGLNNDPDMIEFIANMAKNFSEDKIAGKPVGMTSSPEEAKAEIAKIQAEAMKDRNHPMNNKLHPEYEFFKQKWTDLHKMAYPENA